MGSWVDFWNSEHSIYVNNAHKSAHSRRLLEDITGWISDEAFSVPVSYTHLRANETREDRV